MNSSKDNKLQNRYACDESDIRPWGVWEVLDVGRAFTVKRITVKPGGQLSLQLHHFRSEYWVVVSGSARVTRGDRIVDLKAGETVDIPVETKHRIENTGDQDLIFIEVQYGENLDENDIDRFEDNYGRA